MSVKEIIKDLVKDLCSQNNFFIIADKESEDIVRNFHKELEELGKSSFIIVEGMEEELKNNLNKKDTVLIISKLGNEEFIKNMAIIALKKYIEIYSICSDFRSTLPILSERSIFIKETENFEEKLIEILDYIKNPDKINVEVNGPIINRGKNPKTPEPPEPPEPKKPELTSPLQAMVVEIKVDVGDKVKEGDLICVLEAMKMENDVYSDKEGIIDEILVEPGDTVSEGDALMTLED